MDLMEPGEKITLPMSEYYNAYASAGRLGDACPARKWTVSKRSGKVNVECQPNAAPTRPALPDGGGSPPQT